MKGVILNPLRFYNLVTEPNYLNDFPAFDNIRIGTAYSFGINATQYTVRHIGIMYLQFVVPELTPKNVQIYKQNSSLVFELFANQSTVDISPTGWTGYQIHLLALSLDAGVYQLRYDTHISDDFQIIDNPIYSRDLVKIRYSNSQNKYACIFTEPEFTEFTAYFRGALEPDELINEVDAFESDPTGIDILNAQPQRTAVLVLKGIHTLYRDLVNHIFSLDTININGVDYGYKSAPSLDVNKGGDNGNITVKLIQKTNNYYYG